MLVDWCEQRKWQWVRSEGVFVSTYTGHLIFLTKKLENPNLTEWLYLYMVTFHRQEFLYSNKELWFQGTIPKVKAKNFGWNRPVTFYSGVRIVCYPLRLSRTYCSSSIFRNTRPLEGLQHSTQFSHTPALDSSSHAKLASSKSITLLYLEFSEFINTK